MRRIRLRMPRCTPMNDRFRVFRGECLCRGILANLRRVTSLLSNAHRAPALRCGDGTAISLRSPHASQNPRQILGQERLIGPGTPPRDADEEVSNVDLAALIGCILHDSFAADGKRAGRTHLAKMGLTTEG